MGGSDEWLVVSGEGTTTPLVPTVSLGTPGFDAPRPIVERGAPGIFAELLRYSLG